MRVSGGMLPSNILKNWVKTKNCVWKDHRDKSTGSCSKGSNQQQIVEQIILKRLKRARLILRLGKYSFAIFRKAWPFLFRVSQTYPEEERPCLSKHWKNIFP